MNLRGGGGLPSLPGERGIPAGVLSSVFASLLAHGVQGCPPLGSTGHEGCVPLLVPAAIRSDRVGCLVGRVGSKMIPPMEQITRPTRSSPPRTAGGTFIRRATALPPRMPRPTR